MTQDVKVEVQKAVMERYNKERIHSSVFFESWESSISGGFANFLRKLFRKEPALCRVIVQLSREELLLAKQKKSTDVISLDACKGKEMGVYIAQLTSYDSERNNARMKLLSNDKTINGTKLQGSPLCSEAFFKRFWKKYLRKQFGDDMEGILMR